jgi:hypothetical protein
VDLRRKLVLGTVAFTVLGGLGATAALARSSAPVKAPTKVARQVVSEPVGGTDTDNVQEGDQSGTDQPGTVPAAAAPASVKAGSNSKSLNPADGSGEGENQGEGEGGGGDGPGGHQDPPGNVDHQFDGEE